MARTILLIAAAGDYQQLVLYCEEIGLSSAFTHDDWEIYSRHLRTDQSAILARGFTPTAILLCG